MNPVVGSIRARIDEIVSSDQRRAILKTLGCVGPGGRRIEPRRTDGGAEMLAAIDALDFACLQGDDGKIEAAGARLLHQWARCLSLPAPSSLACSSWPDRTTCRYCGFLGGLTVITCDSPFHRDCLTAFERVSKR
jgi:hypothetical protein